MRRKEIFVGQQPSMGMKKWSFLEKKAVLARVSKEGLFFEIVLTV
jgi:hypothetical protein